MKKSVYEKEMAKEVKKIKREMFKENFCYGFVFDYGAYCMEHPIKAIVPAFGIGVVGGAAIKAAVGTISLPAKLAINVVGSLAVPAAFGLRRAITMDKLIDVQIERA